ncbi:proteasome activator complex subunit 4B [Aplysia californica]|uniref:Proteasome activator complex subunit 4B n=1 Tax=Aplysia californica TaxID=6500 RepID=A0ABM0JSJ5_APLCA|nr:proteasome activator complex subunit 4B [Aplysia californica]
MGDRSESLGYSPQKETSYSVLLPYAEDIDRESNGVLAEIKGNLARSVQLRDLKTGARHWVVQLERYIYVYGYKFSKTDHVLLVKLLFDLVTMPSKEYALTEKFALILSLLLKKRSLLTRADLILPWRPLYKIVEDWSKEGAGCNVFPPKFETNVKNAIRACSQFFHEDATQEMLDEWRPLLCPFDMLVIGGLQCLEMFLPTCLPPELHHKGFKLWFEEFMDLWKSFHSMPSWEGSLVNLFSRLAHDNVGYIDWKPHVPMVFTRLLRSFCLPVGTKQMTPNRHHNAYETASVSTLIVGMMGGPDGTVQEHLTKLFKALHSFYHPSNTGRWTIRLGSFLQTLPRMFVRRLRRERYKELAWLTPVPDSHKLTDAQVTEFVESLKSSVFVAMFGKFGSQDASMALRSLATLRPEIVVPPLLEKMYPAMETLIEPHRLIACMICIVSVARPMLMSPKYYPEGPSHVLPLLNLALPGIDANDFKKTLVTLQMVSTFVSLVPIVDSSDAVHTLQDLTEHEKDLCSATAQFEDFVLCFLDRVHSLIENSRQEASFGALERVTMEQSVMEMGLASTVSAMLQQCSTPIYMSALKKIHRFITTNVFEVKVSGKLAANLCRSVIRIKPEVALKMFIPHFCANIQGFLNDHPGAYEEEHLDDPFLWDLLMLSHAVRCDGSKLLEYKSELMGVIRNTLRLKCVQGYELAGQLLRNLLKVIAQMYPLEFKSVDRNFDSPANEYLPIRDWGAAGDLDNLNVQWHIPSQEELSLATEIVETLLLPEIQFFQNISPSNETSKEDVLRRLNIVVEVVTGAGTHLPPWEGENVQLVESQVPLIRFSCSVSSEKREISAGGKNVRAAVHEAMNHLLKYLSESREDDTKSTFHVIKIYELLMMHYGTMKNDFEGRWKSFHVVKQALGNSLTSKKRHIRALLIDRMQLQHEIRMLNFCDCHFTQRHQTMLNELLNLSVSRYREVRKKAQACLNQAFRTYSYSYLTCLPKVVSNLKDKQVEQHVFKGSLYIVQGGGRACLATKRNWETLAEVWPALVQAQQYEKPSILHVVDDIVNKVFKSLETFSVTFQVSDKVISTATELSTASSAPAPLVGAATQAELEKGVQYEKKRNDAALKHNKKLTDELLTLVESGTLTWKFSQIGFEFLGLVLHDNIPTPASVVSLFVKNCNSELLYIRKLSISAVTTILDLQKQKHKKVPIDLEKAAGVGQINHSSLVPGDRPDNRWLQYNPANFITTEEQWNKMVFIEKTHWGYYCWPKELKAPAPLNEQPKVNRSRSELGEAELPFYDSFLQEEYVAKLFEFSALEEEKSTDKFRQFMLKFYKSLFRNYGVTFLPIFKPHIERLVSDTSHDKHASSQRCAMEALGGIITGSKYWTFPQLESLWAWITPLLEKALNNLTVETLSDWGNFFLHICENRTPHKLQWLYKLLLQNPLSGEGGAFGDSARLYVLQQAILQQEWRIPDYLHAIVNYLKPHLAHNYKSVRDRMGALLSSCMHMDFCIKTNSVTRSPRRCDLINSVLPQLEQFKEIFQPAAGASSSVEPMEVDANPDDSEEKKAAVRLCKTVVHWVSTCFQRSLNPCTVEVFNLLPIIENLQSEANDEDLRDNCKSVILNLSQVLIPENVMAPAFATIKEVSGLKSWHARAAILNYMQQMVFGNFFNLQDPEQKKNVQSLLLHLLCDEQLEVREMAAVTLSGMIHCGFVDMNKDMLDHFERLRSTKVKKVRRSQAMQEPVSLQRLVQRHAGVLGLSACVQAYPYDVPEFIPQVLVDLSVHVNDPQPIGTTVTKTLSNFRRTHHDNWHDHKRMFTDDQLVTLTDLLISPNYYA